MLENEALAEAYNRGLDAEKKGALDEAVAAYRQALALDPADHGGVAVRLAALGATASPDRASPAYVETLFDQQAEAFDYILVDQLGYDVPNLIADRLQRRQAEGFGRVLDLGCGTGLVARALGAQAREIVGLDLSERMIDLCEAADIYDGLYVGDAVEFLHENDEAPFDLIVAADVLPYLGSLDGFFAGVAGQLAVGGLFAFSSEHLDDDEGSFTVTPHQRFAHATTYIARIADDHGLKIVLSEMINVRNQDGAPTPGQLVLAQKA